MYITISSFFSQLDIKESSTKQLYEALQITNKNIEDMLSRELDLKNIDTLEMQLESNIANKISWVSLYEAFLLAVEKLKELWYETVFVSNLVSHFFFCSITWFFEYKKKLSMFA